MAENIFTSEDQAFDQTMLSGDSLQSPDFAMEQPQELTNMLGQTTDTDPPKKNGSTSFESQIQNMVQRTAAEAYTPPIESFEDQIFKAHGAKIKYSNPAQVDQFLAQDDFNPFTFDAQDYDANVLRAAEKETWGDALAKGFDGFASNFGNSFKGWFADYPKMISSIMSSDWQELQPGADEENAINKYYEQQATMNRDYVFAKPGEEEDIFSKKTVSEFLSNAGYTLGTTAALGVEFLADAAITALTEGAGFETFFATFARIGAKGVAREAAEVGLEAAAKEASKKTLLGDVFKGYTAGVREGEELTRGLGLQMRQAEELAAMSSSKSASRQLLKDYVDMWSSNIFNIGRSRSIGEVTNNLVKSLPLVGTGVKYFERGALAAGRGASVGNLIGIGLQGGRRLMQEFNMAASESYFEAITTYGDTLDKMTKQYMLDNEGNAPTAEEFAKMKSLAISASGSNFNTNMGILLITNHLQFGNLFSKYVPTNRFVQDLITEESERVLKITSKRGLEGVIKKGKILGSVSAIGKVWTDFGKKEAMYQLGKSMLKNSLRWEVTEGVQENLQEMSALAWKDYYSGKFNGTKYTLSEAMGSGLSAQFTKQGFKTFLMGALTGTLVRIPTRLMHVGMEKTNEYMTRKQFEKEGAVNPYKQFEERLDEDIKLLNKYIKEGKAGTFEHKLFNFNAQVANSFDQTAAASVGARYEFENGKDNNLLAAVSAANRTGSVDAFMQTIENSVAEMTNEQFKEQFGIDIEDTNYATPQDFATKVVGDIKKYSKSIDDFTTAYKTKLANPYLYDFGTKEYYASRYLRAAQDEAIHIAALNSIKADMAVNRGRQLANELSSSPLLANSVDTVLRVTTDPKMIVAEVGNILADIKNLEAQLKSEGLTSEIRKQLNAQLKAKNKQLEVLNKWSSFFDTAKNMAEREGKDSTDTTPVFVGKRTEKKMKVKKYGNPTQTIKHTYHASHREVLATLKKLIIAKNLEVGIDTEVKDGQVEEALTKLIDYMQLDTDTKDYLNAVEVLTNKERYSEITQSIADGKFKFNLIMYVDTILDKFKTEAVEISNEIRKLNKELSQKDYDEMVGDVEKSLLTEPAYIKLLTMITNEKFGLEQQAEAQAALLEVNELIKQKFNSYITKFTTGGVIGDISDQEYNDIMENNAVGIFRINDIADKLNNSKGDTKVLTEREKEIYEKFPDEIDAKIKELKDAEIKNEEKEIITPETNDDEKDTSEEPENFDDEFDFGDDEFDFSDDDIVYDEEDVDIETADEKTAETEKPVTEYTPFLDEKQQNEDDLKMQKLLDTNVISQEEFDTYHKAKIIRIKLNELGVTDIQDFTSTVVNLISKIDFLAEKASKTFEQFVKMRTNKKLITDMIMREVSEANLGTEITEAPVVEEPVVVEVNNFNKSSTEVFDITLDDVNDLNNILTENLLSDVDNLSFGPKIPAADARDDIERRRQKQNNKISNISFNKENTKVNKKGYTEAIFEGTFLDNYDFLAQGSESTVYLSKDKTHVIKLSEPYSSKDESVYQERIMTGLLKDMFGNSGIEVIGYYEYNGTKNPIFRQDYVEGEFLTEKQVEDYLRQTKGVVEIDKKFYAKYDNKLYRISDFSENVIQDKNGNIVPIDLDIYEITNLEIIAKYDAKVDALESKPLAQTKTDIEKEKANVTSSEFAELKRLAKFFLENPKEPTLSGSVVTRYPALFKALTDIERRRQEELNTVQSEGEIAIFKEKNGISPVNYRGVVSAGWSNNQPDNIPVQQLFDDGTKGSLYWRNKSDIIKVEKIAKYREDEINAKYDAELAALGIAPVFDIEAKKDDIERRRPTSYINESKDKKTSLESFRNESKREWDGVSVITGDRMQNLYVGIKLFVEAYPEYKELLDKFIKKENGNVGITNNNLSFVLNTLKKQGVATESELGSKINAKYQEELAALGTTDIKAETTIENSEKNVNFVNEEVSEESIFAKLKNNKLEC